MFAILRLVTYLVIENRGQENVSIMKQLKLNLELANSEEHGYRGYTIVVYESIPVWRVEHLEPQKNFRGKIKSQSFTVAETAVYYETIIYGKKHSGKRIVSDAWTKEEALIRTKTWIDIWTFGEKEKHRYQR
jgi:hypothetical protein